MQCCKCENNSAVVGCEECAKSLGIEEAKMCEDCSTTLHEALGKFSATHNIVTVDPATQVVQDFERCLREYIELEEQRKAERLKELDDSMNDVQAKYVQLIEDMTQNIEQFKIFLDTKLAEFAASVTVTRDYKLALLAQKKSLIQEKAITVPSTGEDKEIEKKLAELQQSLATLKLSPPCSSLPPLCGGTSCGFPPELLTLERAAVCMKSAHQSDVTEGDSVLTAVIGTMKNDGTFWLRMLPDKFSTQDIILQNISNTLQVDFSNGTPKMSSVGSGDLVAAKYSEDMRWYRARVVSTKNRNGKVVVFFLDYGNTEEVSLSSLAPLHEKYQVYPFQMIQCCFSTDSRLTYEREVKWKFTDLTHNRRLSATILNCSPSNVYGPLYVVQLLDTTSSESFDIGRTILVLVDKRVDRKRESSIKCRDIRLKKQDLPANFGHIISSTSSTTSDQQQQGQRSDGTTSDQPQQGQRSEEPIATAVSIKPASEELHKQEDEPQPREGRVDEEETQKEKSQDEGAEEKTIHDENEQLEVKETEEQLEISGKLIDGEEQRPFQKPQARVKPLKIVKELSPPLTGGTDSVSVGEDGAGMEREKEQVSESNLYPIVEPGMEGWLLWCMSARSLPLLSSSGAVLELYVTTGLSPDGFFWAQLPTSPEYDAMVEQLQEIERDILTPVFFNPGDLCASLYSEDELWYRARIEDVAKGEFTVRYLDFGNSETRENQHLSPLPTKFRVIPFQAIHCSIADESYKSFSQISIDKFDEILSLEDPISAKVTKVEEGVVSVQLHLKIGNAELVDINWEVCSADVGKLESMSFTSRKLKGEEKPEPLLPLSELPNTTNWADFMDDIASPQNDGFLTLSGVESSTGSDRSKTPTPTPLHEKTTPPHPHEKTTVMRRETKRPSEGRSLSPSSTQSEDSKPSPNSRSVPRLDMGVARNRILSSLGPNRKERGSGGESARPRREQLHRTEPVESTESSSTYHQDSAPLFTSISVPHLRRPKRALEADSNQIKIYVANMPLEKTIEEVKEMFGVFGEVFSLRYHPEHRDKIFLIMGRTEGLQAIENLHGHTFKNGQRLIVEVAHIQRMGVPGQRSWTGAGFSSSPPPRQRSPMSGSSENVSSGEKMKLFVKNIPFGKTLEEMRELFSKYGKVYSIVQDPQRKHVVYLHTTVESGRKAIQALHGRAISKNSRPLVVEESCGYM